MESKADKIQLLAIVLCLFVATAVADEKKKNEGEQQQDQKKKIRFHFGGNYEPYDYLVNLPGQPEQRTGFGYEFADMLCKRNNLDCVFIRDNYEECWRSGDYPGMGLYNDWYDACSTYTNTHLRQLSVDFSDAYTRERPAGILSRLDSEGNPVIHPRDTDLGGKTVGIVGGWATNAPSLRYIPNKCEGDKQYTNYKVETPEDEFSGPDAVMRMLIDGKVDGVFLYSSLIEDRMGCTSEVCDPSLYNGLGTQYAWIHTGIVEYQANGTTLAFTKRGSDLNAYLNPLIADMIDTKEYADLCEKYAEQDIDCFPNQHRNKLKVDKNAMDDIERKEYCDQQENPGECLSCAKGHCGCDVPRSKGE